MNIRTLTPVEVEKEEEPYPSNMLITPSTTRKKGGTSKLQIDESILEKRDLKAIQDSGGEGPWRPPTLEV